MSTVSHVSPPIQSLLLESFLNPFNSATTIRYSSFGGNGTRQGVSLQVFDVLGRQVATLVDDWKEPGTYTVEWDAAEVSSGVYFCRLVSGDFVQTRTMLLLR